jgi:hypothetical protein
MAYTINKTSGAVLSTVSDGTVDTTTDLTLIGKNYAGYGEFLNENLIKLLENFANATAPSAPVAGQMWWDTASSLLKVYTGTSFKTVSSSTASASTPSSSVTGDLWWDTTNGQLKVYNGSAFTTIGPAFTSGSGTSGAIVETVTDSGATDHVVVKMYANNTVVSTITKDTTFTPQSAISGFATISPGMQISTSVSGAKLHGTATDADKLGGSAASAYLRVDQSDSTSGVFSVLNDTGLVVGVDSDLTVGVSGSDVSIANATSDGDILFKVNDGGVVSTALTVDGATNRVLVAGDPTTSLGIASKAYVDAQLSASGDLKADASVTIKGILKPDANNTRDFGTAGLKFATIHATTFSGVSTSAQYADVAENFSADASYSPGTVVALGGAAEITRLNEELSDSVFGVISNKPAYLMNAGLEGGLPVAVSGRVPVRVIGMISKGERLVSAGDGLARSAHPGEANSFNVIGRALNSKTTIDEGVIEAFVTIN